MEFIELQNSEGRSISVRFRPARAEDAPAIVGCIRDEYGEKYHKRKMYDTEYLIRQGEAGRLNFYVVELPEGNIIGILGIQRDLPEDASCSITTGIVLKPYRGYHIFFPLAKYIAREILAMESVSAIYCRMILYHDITQKRMQRLGLVPCGLVPGLIAARNFQHSYERDGNEKLTLGMMIRKREKRDAGTLYLPPEHREIAERIYGALRVKYEISAEIRPLEGASDISFSNDALQRTGTIEIHAPGADLVDKIREIHREQDGEGQTFNAFLNISHPGSIAAYHELAKLGYFFAGFRPICCRHELMVLHHPGRVRIDFDALRLIPSFADLRDYVRNCYERRCVTKDGESNGD